MLKRSVLSHAVQPDAVPHRGSTTLPFSRRSGEACSTLPCFLSSSPWRADWGTQFLCMPPDIYSSISSCRPAAFLSLPHQIALVALIHRGEQSSDSPHVCRGVKAHVVTAVSSDRPLRGTFANVSTGFRETRYPSRIRKIAELTRHVTVRMKENKPAIRKIGFALTQGICVIEYKGLLAVVNRGRVTVCSAIT